MCSDRSKHPLEAFKVCGNDPRNFACNNTITWTFNTYQTMHINSLHAFPLISHTNIQRKAVPLVMKSVLGPCVNGMAIKRCVWGAAPLKGSDTETEEGTLNPHIQGRYLYYLLSPDLDMFTVLPKYAAGDRHHVTLEYMTGGTHDTIGSCHSKAGTFHDYDLALWVVRDVLPWGNGGCVTFSNSVLIWDNVKLCPCLNSVYVRVAA